MAQEFQTSFIPKKTFDVGAPARTTPNSLSNVLSFIAFILLLLSIVGAAGVFLYERFLISSIESKKESLERAKSAFEPELIRELSRLDAKLRISRGLLDGHVAPSGILDLLEDITLQTVRFTTMSYGIGDTGVNITLSGEALSFASVALQSDEFGKHRSIKEPIFSGLTLDDRGNVEFSVSALIDPAIISYRERAAGAGSALLEVGEGGDVAGTATSTGETGSETTGTL